MRVVQWLQPPRVVLTLFVGLMAVCALALGWLGWQVVRQDRAVETQQRQQQLGIAADRAVAAIERAFTHSDAEVAVTANGDIEIMPTGRLAYAPTEAIATVIQSDIFSEPEALEFGGHDPVKAAQGYVRIAASGPAPVRGEELVPE